MHVVERIESESRASDEMDRFLIGEACNADRLMPRVLRTELDCFLAFLPRAAGVTHSRHFSSGVLPFFMHVAASGY